MTFFEDKGLFFLYNTFAVSSDGSSQPPSFCSFRGICVGVGTPPPLFPL